MSPLCHNRVQYLQYGAVPAWQETSLYLRNIAYASSLPLGVVSNNDRLVSDKSGSIRESRDKYYKVLGIHQEPKIGKYPLHE